MFYDRETMPRNATTNTPEAKRLVRRQSRGYFPFQNRQLYFENGRWHLKTDDSHIFVAVDLILPNSASIYHLKFTCPACIHLYEE
jgi:hypothetical protein